MKMLKKGSMALAFLMTTIATGNADSLNQNPYATNFQSSVIEPAESRALKPEKKFAETPVRIWLGKRSVLKDKVASHHSVKIVIDHLSFEGLARYSPEEAQAFFKSLMGKEVTIEDFILATKQLIRKYWNDGYVLAEAEVKFKEFESGKRDATIHIHEGEIKKIVVKGDGDEGVQELLQNYGGFISAVKPFNIQAFESYNSLTTYLPGLSIWGDIKPIADEPGTGDLELITKQQKITPYFVVDNRGSKFVGPYRGMIGAYAMSVLKKADLVNMSFVTTPSKELSYGRLSYLFPLNYSGDTVSLRAEYGKFQPGFTYKNLDNVSHDFRLEALYQHTTFAVPGHQMVLKAGLNAFITDSVTPTSVYYKDQIRELIVGVSDSFSDSLGGQNVAEVRLYQGIRALGGMNKPIALRSESDGEATATRFFGEWIHAHPLPNRFSFVAQVKAQYSLQALLDATSFYVGGYPYGSAYDPGEISGDHGLSGRLEGRYAFEKKPMIIDRISSYVFLDGGKVWNRHLNPGYKGKSLLSVGAGVRLTLYKNYDLNFEVAKPLTLKLRSELVPSTTRPLRFFFSLSGRF